MIIEAIITWLLSVLQYAVGLLPSNGSLFSNVPDLTFSAFKYITLLNGYIPIKEIGTVFVITLAVQAAMFAIRIVFGLFNQLTKVIP